MNSIIKTFKDIGFILIIINGINTYSQDLETTKARIKKDTIYIYFKGKYKDEIKHKYVGDSLTNNYQIEYKFLFDYKHQDTNLPVIYRFLSFSHSSYDGKFKKIPLIEKEKKFVKTIKDKIYSYCDFKNKDRVEINLFFTMNNNKTVYLIDNSEFVKGKIFLRKVIFTGNFPKVQ